MATKAELEDELTALKAEIAAMRQAAATPGGDVSGAGRGTPDGGEANTEAGDHGDDDGILAGAGLDRVLAQLDGIELEKLLKRFGDELGHLHKSKPLLTVFGAFALGFLFGRGR